jgi:hypothetical protein
MECWIDGTWAYNAYRYRYCDAIVDNVEADGASTDVMDDSPFVWRLLDVGPAPKIASSRKLNATLLIDRRDEENARVVTWDGTSFSSFVVCPSTLSSWNPTSINVDDARNLVLVGDSENLKIHAFDFEGNVVHTIFLPLITTTLAFRPGIFAPLSDVSLTTASPTTTSPVVFSTSFRDRFGEPLATDVDFSNFAIKASFAGTSSESNIEVTETGDVSEGGEGAIRFSINVTRVGLWTFTLVDVFADGYAAAYRNSLIFRAPDSSFAFSLLARTGTRSTSAARPTRTPSPRARRIQPGLASILNRESRLTRSSASTSRPTTSTTTPRSTWTTSSTARSTTAMP